jgi:hypothetical protein
MVWLSCGPLLMFGWWVVSEPVVFVTFVMFLDLWESVNVGPEVVIWDLAVMVLISWVAFWLICFLAELLLAALGP